jgi:hypothetical protein
LQLLQQFPALFIQTAYMKRQRLKTMIATRVPLLFSRSSPRKPIPELFFPGSFLAMAAPPRTDCAAADIHRDCAVIQNVNHRFMAGQMLKLSRDFPDCAASAMQTA